MFGVGGRSDAAGATADDATWCRAVGVEIRAVATPLAVERRPWADTLSAAVALARRSSTDRSSTHDDTRVVVIARCDGGTSVSFSDLTAETESAAAMRDLRAAALRAVNR
jgi:hypothetical protein